MALTKIPASLLDTSSGINGLIYPSSDGTAGQFLKTDGSGNLTFATTYTDSDVETYLDGGTSTPTFASATVSGALTVTGDLNITGDINSYNVTDLDVTDQTITLGAGQIEANSGGSGIIVDGSNASILWDETNDTFDINNSINVTGSVTSDGLTVDGNTKLNGSFTVNGNVDTSASLGEVLQLSQTDSIGGFLWSADRATNTYKNMTYYANVHKFLLDATTEALRINSSGIDVTGSVAADGLTVNSSEVLFDNTGGDFTLKLNTNAVSDKNEIIMGDSGTPLAKFGVGGTANDIITGSDGQDFNIGTAGGGRAINFSTDNFASVEMKLDGGKLGIGTDSPAAGLQVSKGLTNAGGPAAGASTAAACFGNDGSDDNYGLVLGADGFGKGYISAQRTDGTATTYDLSIQPNGGNVGIGCLPDAWSGYSVLQIGNSGALSANEDVTFLSANGYSSSTGWRYATTDEASLYQQQGGEHIWLRANSGSADGLITWAEGMRLKSDRLKLQHSLEIVNSSAAEIILSGVGSGNLVSESDLYLLAGSGTASGTLYLGSDGTNGQAEFVGGKLGLGATPNATLHVSTSDSKIVELERGSNVYDLTISDVGEGDAQLWFNAQTTNTGFNFRPKDSGGTNNNALFIAPNGDVAIGGTGLSLTNGSIGPSLKIQSDNRGTDVALILEADSGEFALYSYNNKFEVLETKTAGTVSYLTTLQHDGKYGINTRTPHGRLDVKGGITLINGNVDFGTHNHTSYASLVDSGEINFTVGYSGTLTASRNFVFTYQATNWKAWGCEIEMATTEGLATWKVGGYNNNSSGHNSYEENDQNAMASLTYTTSGQQNIITLGFDRTHIHPCFRVRYFQSGGDGAPRMDRVKVEIT
jgi:hypothetical protein